MSSIDGDMEFECIETEFLVDRTQVPFNVLDPHAKNHPAERSIRTVKERVRIIIQSPPSPVSPKLS